LQQPLPDLSGEFVSGNRLLIVRFPAPYLTPKQDNAQMRMTSEEKFFLRGGAISQRLCYNRRQRVAFLWGVEEMSPILLQGGSNGRLTVALPYSVEQVARMKTIPGHRWHPEENVRVCPTPKGW
jgi:hypothetical protein